MTSHELAGKLLGKPEYEVVFSIWDEDDNMFYLAEPSGKLLDVEDEGDFDEYPTLFLYGKVFESWEDPNPEEEEEEESDE